MSGAKKSWQQQVEENRAAKDALKAQAKGTASTGQKVNTQGWRTFGNAFLFRLNLQDHMTAYYLKKGNMQLTGVQSTDSYDFEVHPMHTIGRPIYIRMKDNEDSGSVPKFDTKGKPAPKLAARGSGKKKTYDFHNLEKLTLGQTELIAMERLITDNYAFLSYLAEQVYEVDGIV